MLRTTVSFGATLKIFKSISFIQQLLLYTINCLVKKWLPSRPMTIDRTGFTIYVPVRVEGFVDSDVNIGRCYRNAGLRESSTVERSTVAAEFNF